jgi:hypothetical protein
MGAEDDLQTGIGLKGIKYVCRESAPGVGMDGPMTFDDPNSTVPVAKDSGSAAIALAEREDLERKLHAVRKKKNRHVLWAMLGISPAAIIPAIGLLAEGDMGLLMVLLVLVFLAQVHGWGKTSKEARELEKELLQLSESANP